jgi:D-alanyl-D-alanine carboxypeptidase
LQIASAATHRTVAKIEESKDVAAAQPKAAEPPAHPQPYVPPRLARADAMPAIANLVTPAEAAPAPAPAESQTAAVLAATALSRQPKPGSGEPINPVKVKTITVKAGNVQTAMLVPLTAPAPQASVAPPHFAKSAVVMEPTTQPPGARPGVLGVLPVEAPAAKPAVYETAAATSMPVVTTASTSPRPAHPRRPWMIQVGAFPKETEAKDRLREAQSMAGKIVARAEPFTEKVMRGNQELYRARFAGFNQDSAEAACKHFKRNDIACMVTRN